VVATFLAVLVLRIDVVTDLFLVPQFPSLRGPRGSSVHSFGGMIVAVKVSGPIRRLVFSSWNAGMQSVIRNELVPIMVSRQL
jgi:hypothetical protein